MKIILIIMALALGLLAQEPVWSSKYYDSNGVDHSVVEDGSFDKFSSGTYYSIPFNLSFWGNDHTGLWGFAVMVGQPSGDSQTDTLRCYLSIWAGRSIGWVNSTILTLNRRAFSDTGYVASKTYLIDNSSDSSYVWFWQSSPADDYSIYAYPYNRVRLYITVSGSGYLDLKQEVEWVTYDR